VPCAVAQISSGEPKHPESSPVALSIHKVKRVVKPETLQILSLWRDVCREKTNCSKVVRKTHPMYDEIKAEFDKRSKSAPGKQLLEDGEIADATDFSLGQ
jgi:hypothetical protein